MWPPRVVERAGPWLLRAADGFTGRANTVAVLGAADRAEAARLIPEAEAFAARHGIPPAFHVADTPRTVAARAALGDAGYRPDDETVLVMQRPVAGGDPLGRSVAGAAAVRVGGDLGPDDAWVATWWAVFPRGGTAALAAGRALLERIPQPRTFARVPALDGPPTAVGLAAVREGWALLAAIGVQPPARRQGLGTAVTAALLDWAAGVGARHAWLQVTADNLAAVRSYERLGFVSAYTYRYWRR